MDHRGRPEAWKAGTAEIIEGRPWLRHTVEVDRERIRVGPGGRVDIGLPAADVSLLTHRVARIFSRMSDHLARLSAALADRYRIQRQLGEGGMATVYLADDLRHERSVAVKVLKPQLAAVLGAERFLTEIKTTANLQHPHILPLFDSGTADSFLYYVMPFVDGESLEDRLERDQQLPVDEAVRIAIHVAEALEYAHEHGVVHRDVKPANILLQAGTPVVSDFGIALAVGAAGGGRLTETGLSLGTPHYMSPEQAAGDTHVGPAADTYALGCVLYEMLSGEPPNTGRTPQAVLSKIITGEIEPVRKHRPSVPANVEAAIGKALERLPADRFRETGDFAKALADPGFRHGVPAGGSGGVSARWRALGIATSATTAALLAALLWAPNASETPARIARFESPFRPGEAPILFESRSFGLSPDGSMLIYSGPGDGVSSNQLWMRRWDRPDATPLPGTALSVFPDVSPDGQELLFAQFAEVKRVSLGGGPVQSLAPGVWPRWGPGGNVYLTTPLQGLSRVPAEGGTVETVTTLAEGESQHAIYDMLPGGAMALIQVDFTDGRSEIRVLDLSDGDMRPLLPGALPSYVPSGHLLYLVQEGGDLMAAPFDAKRAELRGPGVAMLPGVTNFTVSDRGDLFYASVSAVEDVEDTELVWVTRAGAATPVEPGWVFDRGTEGAYGWSLSPDGTQIAVQRRLRGNTDIWIKALPRAPIRRLTFEPGPEAQPFWSPRGDTVAFFRGTAGSRTLWAGRADGTGEPVLLADPPFGVSQGSWSRDGAWMVLRAAVPAPATGLMDIAAWRPGIDTLHLLVRSDRSLDQEPALSPDGRWLAYSSNETGQFETFVRPFPDVDTGKWQASIDGGSGPLWSPAGDELFYVNARREVVAIRFTTGSGFAVTERETLFTLPPRYLVDVNATFLDIAPDGERFLMGRTVDGAATGNRRGATLVLVQNFVEELRR